MAEYAKSATLGPPGCPLLALNGHRGMSDLSPLSARSGHRLFEIACRYLGVAGAADAGASRHRRPGDHRREDRIRHRQRSRPAPEGVAKTAVRSVADANGGLGPLLTRRRLRHFDSLPGFLINSPGKSTLSSCRPSLLHGRWRDWCQAAALSWGRPVPDDESAAPAELVPGAAGLVPKAPPVTDVPPVPDIWDPMPPPRANAAVVERLTQSATQRTESFSCRDSSNTRSTRRLIPDAHTSDVGSQFAATH